VAGGRQPEGDFRLLAPQRRETLTGWAVRQAKLLQHGENGPSDPGKFGVILPKAEHHFTIRGIQIKLLPPIGEPRVGMQGWWHTMQQTTWQNSEIKNKGCRKYGERVKEI
jgi:hypothetical protein